MFRGDNATCLAHRERWAGNDTERVKELWQKYQENRDATIWYTMRKNKYTVVKLAAKWRKTSAQDMLRQRNIAKGAERGGHMVGGKGGQNWAPCLTTTLTSKQYQQLRPNTQLKGRGKGNRLPRRKVTQYRVDVFSASGCRVGQMLSRHGTFQVIQETGVLPGRLDDFADRGSSKLPRSTTDSGPTHTMPHLILQLTGQVDTSAQH